MRLLAALMVVAIAANAETLRVQSGGHIVEVDLERYVAGVLAGEASVFRSEEALKAMAVTARTYAVRFRSRHAAEGFGLCDKTHCQRLDLQAITPRFTAIAKTTEGQLVLDRNQAAATYFHRDCGGMTENVRDVWPEENAPYLTAHADPYCVRHGSSAWHWRASLSDLAAALLQSGLRVPVPLQSAAVTQRTPSGRAQQVTLQGVRVSASSLRFAVGRTLGFNSILSDKYNIGLSGNSVVFDGMGSGHGVGLCQNGAEQMGLEGKTYREILAFYYPGTSVSTKDRLNWQRVSGERIALFTTQLDRDGTVLATAERLLRTAESRVKLPAGSVEIRIYPDVATFRDTTGEPGWVAARTRGNQIDMQPAALLRGKGLLESTLQHELLHTILEAQARPGLPVWFREGLAAYFSNSAALGGTVAVQDEELRQYASEDRARSAYTAARARVSDLIARYGETTVLGWLKLGLPREVTNASAKQAPTKSK